MDQKRVCLTVPAEPGFARIVRMTAASLAVTCDMGVDEVEDARMAAEEGFVYACATGQQECGVCFAGYEGFQTGDTIECYSLEELPRSL